MMSSLTYAAPPLLLFAGSCFVLLAGLWVTSNGFLLGASLLSVIGATALFCGMAGNAAQTAFSGLLAFDPFGLFFSVFVTLVTAAALLMGAKSKEIGDDRRSEYYAIVLSLAVGLIFMSMANHLLMIYLAIETVSILSYTLSGFNRGRYASAEAALKYVVYGAMSAAIMVYGMSLIYGITGQLTLDGIRNWVSHTPPEQIPALMWVGVLMIFAGIGYKVSAAPMHMWTPDVYEGAPTPVSGFLSVAPKAAGFALLLRFFITAFSLPLETGAAVVATGGQAGEVAFHIVGPMNWPKFLMFSSVFTMFIGNLAALGQVSVKRLLAYSSISHAGYILMGAATQTFSGLYSMVFYVLVYCFMNLGAFWVTALVDDTFGSDELKSFRGLAKRRPFLAVCMAIFMFSLVGIPPFAGFIGKLYLFSAVVSREMYGFALLAAINSLISLYYYMKVVKAMFLEASEVPMLEGKTPMDCKLSLAAIALLALPNLLLIINWEPVVALARKTVVFFAG